MRVLIIFNHPAPYKVKAFNELSKYVDLTVIFERTKASDRPDSFYDANEYKFNAIFLKDGYVGREGTVSSKVRSYIKEHHSEYDLIIMNGYSHLAEMKAIRYMVNHKIPFTLLINGGVIKKESPIKKAFKTAFVSRASHYLSPSKKASEYLVHYGADKAKIHQYLYSNYYEKDILDAPISDKSELRKKYNLPLDKKIFVNASQFIERKNNIQLMSLFKNREDILLLVGEGKEKEKYEKYILDNKLNNVIIRPFMKKDDLFELLKACDVYITLSKEDIFGHTTLEAFTNGLPVISSNKVISSLEYIKDGFNGYLVDLNDNKDILKKMDITDYSLSSNAIASAKNNTFENSAKSLYNAMEEIYGK